MERKYTRFKIRKALNPAIIASTNLQTKGYPPYVFRLASEGPFEKDASNLFKII